MVDDAPKSARDWLDKINKAEKAFEVYGRKCDSISKLYANLEKLASNTGDAEFQIFWANLEVLKPSIYTRPPRPVVMPRHSDLGEVVRKASEMIERGLQYDVEADDLHETLCAVRDDLAICARGVPWVLDNGQCVHVERCDFLHEPARKWPEVTWVARAVYLTKEEGRERFGARFKNVELNKIGDDKEGGEYKETLEKAKVWEIWCKASRRVYYVTEGVDELLDESEAFIDVKGFFPCPKPAYGTLQPGTLLPVPDFVYYRDQVDEINVLTRRIRALAESLRMKGFYAAGTSEIGEAIEAALKQSSDKAILVPVSNFAALGNVALKDSIVWLPVREIGELVNTLVLLRKQLIEDVYEITGISDIMRGNTEASETATAQNLKSQYGSVRVRERQGEMVRIAVDVLRIKAEIYCETLPIDELMQMAAMQLPSMADIQAQMAQLPPEQAQQMKVPVAKEQVDQLIKAQRIRPFLLEVESDSTIAPDEEKEKASRIEFLGAMGQFMQQAGAAVAAQPETAPFLGELMKFTAGGFRAGRDLGGAIDDFVEQVRAKAAQVTQGQQQPDPEAIKAQMEGQIKQAEMQMKQAEMQAKAQETQTKLQLEAQKAAQDRELRMMEMQATTALKRMELALKRAELGVKEDEVTLKERQAELDALFRMEETEMEREQERAVKLGDEG